MVHSSPANFTWSPIPAPTSSSISSVFGYASCGCIQLFVRTTNRTVGTEYAAISQLRFQNFFAVSALIEEDTCISRHCLFFLRTADWTTNDGLEDQFHLRPWEIQSASRRLRAVDCEQPLTTVRKNNLISWIFKKMLMNC